MCSDNRPGGDAGVPDAPGRPIGRLYVAGTGMNPAMGGDHPGADITLGPTLTFRYRAAMHIANGRAKAVPHASAVASGTLASE